MLAALLAAASIVYGCEAEDLAKPPRVLTAAQHIITEHKLTYKVAQCTFPPGALPIPSLNTQITPDGTLIFVVSRDFEDLLSDSAVRGVAGHELGHFTAGDHQEEFWHSLTPAQQLAQEASADTAAMKLVGRDDITAAMDEYQVIVQQAAVRCVTKIRQELDFRRQQLKASDAKAPSP